MAEGVLSGVLGEEESAEAESREVIVGGDAFAAAIAIDYAKFDPAVAAAAATFLRDQSHLSKVQAHGLASEHPLRLAGQRIRLGMQVFVALALTVVGLILGVMLVDAFQSRTVIVEAFDAPSVLAPRGLTGTVVASSVLDHLTLLQAATRTGAAKRGLSNAWSGDIKVEVPETGLSVGDIDRMLKARFGHDIHINGDLVQTEAGGLALTVRGDGVPAKTFEGPSSDLEKLTSNAAEYVYGRSEPSLFAAYLNDKGRYQDSVAFLPDAFSRAATDAERAELANAWGNAYAGMGKSEQAVEKLRLTMSLSPRWSPVWWKGWTNLVGNMQAAQGEEAAWRESRAYIDAREQAPSTQKPELRLLVNPAGLTWDLPLLLAANLDDEARNGGAGSGVQIDGPTIADSYALLHDWPRAMRYMASSDPADSVTKAEALLIQAYVALDRGDGAAATAPMEAFWKAWKADPGLQYTYPDSPCLLGRAYGLSGRLADAEAVFKQAGAWSRCYAFHGEALLRAGDRPGAERVWDQGLSIAASPPFVYLFRGIAEMNRGDFMAAEVDLASANTTAPHYPEPLKAWGDLEVRQGRWKSALAKYDEALKYAPAWSELQQARRAAAAR